MRHDLSFFCALVLATHASYGKLVPDTPGLRPARSISGEHLPAATLCCVWDRLLPAGAVLPVLALVVGGDADNTGGQSVGWVGDVPLLP